VAVKHTIVSMSKLPRHGCCTSNGLAQTKGII